MVNVVPLTFIGASIAYRSTKFAELFCKLAVH